MTVIDTTAECLTVTGTTLDAWDDESVTIDGQRIATGPERIMTVGDGRVVLVQPQIEHGWRRYWTGCRCPVCTAGHTGYTAGLRSRSAGKTPSQGQTIDPVETWESHHLSRSPEAPGQHTSGPAAAAETQPCSTGEARSNRDGEGGAPGAAPSHLPPPTRPNEGG